MALKNQEITQTTSNQKSELDKFSHSEIISDVSLDVKASKQT